MHVARCTHVSSSGRSEYRIFLMIVEGRLANVSKLVNLKSLRVLDLGRCIRVLLSDLYVLLVDYSARGSSVAVFLSVVRGSGQRRNVE